MLKGLSVVGLFLFVLVLVFYWSPLLIENLDFTLGFVCCLVLLVVWMILMEVKNLIYQKKEKSGNVFSFLLPLVFIAVLLLGNQIIKNQKAKFKLNERAYYKKELLQKEKIVAEKNRQLTATKNELFIEVEQELKTLTNRILSDETIEKISSLSKLYQPYEKYDEDLDKVYLLSDERGQLLLDLIDLNLNPSAFTKIKQNVSFSFANLKAAELRDLDLSFIELNGALLSEAYLSRSNLSQSKLNDANLKSSHLDSVIFINAIGKRMQLGWAHMNGAKMDSSIFDGSIYNNATLKNCSFHETRSKYSSFLFTNFNDSNLKDSDLSGSDLSKSSFKRVDLTRANLRHTIWTHADLSHSILKSAVLRSATLKYTNLQDANLNNIYVQHSDWLEKIKKWNVVGLDVITKEFTLHPDDSMSSSYILLSN